MLVLTRRVGEAIWIGKEIRITVQSINRGRVRLGIAAPGSIRVDREEVSVRQREFAAETDRLKVTLAPAPDSTKLD